jgi:hypothetical protein
MTEGKPAPKRPTCPACGSREVVPILYGYPEPEAISEAAKGALTLGGCCVGDDDPRKHCRDCGEDFDRPRGGDSRPL